MNHIAKIRHQVKTFVEQHGSKAGMCAKIATALLLPGGGGLPEVMRALCDYSADQDLGLTDDRLMEGLGELKGNQEQVATVLEHLNGQLSDVMSKMSKVAELEVPEHLLTQLMHHALANQSELSEVRSELMSLQPELSTIRAQNEALLRQQAFAGDLLLQVSDTIKAAMGYCAPLMSEGVPADKTMDFLQAHMSFQRCLLRADLAGAESALESLKKLSKTSDTVKVCEISLMSVKGDFEGADRLVQSISHTAQRDTLIQAMSLSVASATQALRSQAGAVTIDLPHRQPGQTLGSKGWVLRSLIGRGGMGVVWSVESPQEGSGALKLMAKNLSDNPSFVRRFESEIALLRYVNHEAVVKVLDSGKDHDGSLFLVMQLIQGTSLRSRLKGGQQLTQREARNLLIELLEALNACHCLGVIHRDLKPDNIMMNQDNRPVLIDFGLAQREGSAGQESRVVITRNYAAPEQHRASAVGPEVDLYALGHTIIESLGGWPHVPPDLKPVMERLTQHDPQRRGTAQEHLSTLQEHLSALQEDVKYHINIGSQGPKGPFTVSEVTRQLLNVQERALIFWKGAPGWQLISDVPEVYEALTRARAAQPPPPPPSKLPRADFGNSHTSHEAPKAFKPATRLNYREPRDEPDPAAPDERVTRGAPCERRSEPSGLLQLPTGDVDRALSQRSVALRAHVLNIRSPVIRPWRRHIRPTSPPVSPAPHALRALARLLTVREDELTGCLSALSQGEAYQSFVLKTPAKDRLIQAPRGTLKLIQKKILTTILYATPMSAAAHGGQPHRTIVTNATPHLHDADSVLTLDLKDAYPALTFRDVYRAYYKALKRLLPIFNLYDAPEQEAPQTLRAGLAELLTTLSTAPRPDGSWALPQGGSTSAALLNLCCARLDRMIYRVLRDFRGIKPRYTRYLDDITISASAKLPPELVARVKGAIVKADLNINHQKTQLHQSIGSGLFGSVELCGLKAELRSSRLSFSKPLQRRLVDRLSEGAHPRVARGVIEFTRLIYPQSPKFILSTPWAKRHPERLWSELESPYQKQLVTRGGPIELETLGLWLDLSVEDLQSSLALLKRGEAYTSFKLSKGSGGFRQITAPVEPLKRVQRRILERLLYQCPVSTQAHGFTPQRSIVSNATPHLGARSIFGLDLKDAFPSIKRARVRHALQRHLGHPVKHLGPQLSGRERALLWDTLVELLTYQGKLPQGSPASGYLLNLCLLNLDKLLTDLASAHQLTYTRYADDLTFSSREDVIPSGVCAQLMRVVIDQHLVVNTKKIELQRLSSKGTLEVCGLLVDHGAPRLPPRTLKAYRSLIRRLTWLDRISEEDRRQLSGSLSFVQMVYAGELPQRIRGPLERLYQVHPELTRASNLDSSPQGWGGYSFKA